MSLLTKLLAEYHRRGLLGSYRITVTLARLFKSLRQVSITTENGDLFADLRISSSHPILAWPMSLSGEDRVMKQFVNKGDVVFDIGAHLGLYTLLLSKLVGDEGVVNAFEPNPELLPSLEKTVDGCNNVVLRKVGLADRSEDVDLFVPEDPSMASLSDWTHGIAGKVHTSRCHLVTIDDLVENENVGVPSFIKCDIEGAEFFAFMGGKKTLDTIDAPVILFEANSEAANSFGLAPTQCIEFLKALKSPGYEFFEVLDVGLRVLDAKSIKYANIVAVPANRMETCRKMLHWHS